MPSSYPTLLFRCYARVRRPRWRGIRVLKIAELIPLLFHSVQLLIKECHQLVGSVDHDFVEDLVEDDVWVSKPFCYYLVRIYLLQRNQALDS